MSTLTRCTTDLINLLFPDLCNACGNILYHGEALICTTCLYDLPFTDYHLYAANPVARQFWGRVPIHAAMSFLYFGKGSRVQQMIHALKYKGRTQLGVRLGEMLGTALLKANLYQGITMIIPVPLHKKQERNRGYNQSKCIADGIALVLNVPVENECITRIKRTESQTKKTRFNRYLNMTTVFSVINPAKLENQYILLVDDVMTTGSTLEACATLLLEHKLHRLSIATLAFVK